MTSLRWTSTDIELLPDNGKQHEVIDRELYMSKQPHWHHQFICTQLCAVLQAWNDQTKVGLHQD